MNKSFDDKIEEIATAWLIGLGYTPRNDEGGCGGE